MISIQKLRFVYNTIAFVVFVFQASKSIDRYFQYPVVILNMWTTIEKIEKPAVHVCLQVYFNYNIADKYGYSMQSKFLAGMIQNSTKPTWKGIHGNVSSQNMIDLLFDTDFSKLKMDKPSKIFNKFGKGFCLKVNGLEKDLKITNKGKDLRVFFVQSSTDPKIYVDVSPNAFVKLISTSNTTFDYKVYEIVNEIHDNTIYEGISCVDYRKQDEQYGECNYKALKELLLSNFGCCPPWIDGSEGKQCENDLTSKTMEKEKYKKIWQDIDDLTDGIKIELMKVCPQPCYAIKSRPLEKNHVSNFKGQALLKVWNSEEVPIFKAVHSFDITTLAVELGSQLGLWLGRYSYKMKLKS